MMAIVGTKGNYVGALQVSAPAPFSDDELHHETVAFLKMMDFKTNCLASLSFLKV